MKRHELDILLKHFLKSDQSNIEEFIKIISNILYSNFGKCELYNGKVSVHDDTNWLETYESIPNDALSNNNLLEESMKVFDGQIRWNSMATMHNINPPMLMDSVIGNMIANMYNPNVLWDYVSADAQKMERQVVRQIAELCEWNIKKVAGAFTFGGKACLMYAIRIGLGRAIKTYATNGLNCKNKPVVITSKENHYTIEYVCSLLGIGKTNCIRIPTYKDKMDMNIFKEKIVKCMKNDIPIAAIIVLGGNTINNSMDSLNEVHDIVIMYRKKYNLQYTPYIHFDTVVGWPWLFFRYYNFEKNELEIQKKVLEVLKENYKLISQVKYADSMGVDFHKIGFVPYQSSVFVVKDGRELFSINQSDIDWLDEKEYGNNFTQHYTLEHSRSFAPIYSGWLALQNVGKKGFISYLAYVTEIAFYLRECLEKIGFYWINQESKGFASVFWCTYIEGVLYQDIYKWSTAQIQKQNEYMFNLCEVLGQGKYVRSRYIFACIPDYIHSYQGEDIATLRIFPMSLELSHKNIDFMIKDIKKIKKMFETEFINETAEIISSCIEKIPR